MNFKDRLKYGYNKGYFSLIKRTCEWHNDPEYVLFFGIDGDKDFNFGEWENKEKDAFSFYSDDNYISQDEIQERAENENWEFIHYVHPSELMGKIGFLAEEKVKIKSNAKEICEDSGFDWDEDKHELLEQGYAYVEEFAISSIRLKKSINSAYCAEHFPLAAIEPIFSEEEVKKEKEE